MRVAVVGGGIAGLAAAWDLRDRADVVVYEPGRLGGKLQTSSFGGVPVDEGPDAFLTRVPGATVLCEELGLSPTLVAPSASRTLLWSGGKLRAIPGGLVLGVPKGLLGVARSGLLTPAGVARAALDLVLPRLRVDEDTSIDEIVAGRFGTQVAHRLVEPLLGSIHAARTSQLSAAATAPQLLSAVHRSRSLLLALRREAPAGSGGSIFLAPRGGMSALVSTLLQRLRGSGVRFVNERVDAVRRATGGGVEVDGERYDGSVLAVSAPRAANLIGQLAPVGLADVALTDVTLLTLSIATQGLAISPEVSGILVPPDEGTLMTACSFGSHKWPHWSGTPDRTVVRVSCGRNGDRRPGELDDQALTNRLVDELGVALGWAVDPLESRLSRWPGAFPLYSVGHLERVSAFEGRLEESFPEVRLAGSSYRGSGIPACITSGRAAANSLASRLAGADLRRTVPETT
jgi:protoporphyrinogen/coproporphyrinogen III oxidase